MFEVEPPFNVTGASPTSLPIGRDTNVTVDGQFVSDIPVKIELFTKDWIEDRSVRPVYSTTLNHTSNEFRSNFTVPASVINSIVDRLGPSEPNGEPHRLSMVATDGDTGAVIARFKDFLTYPRPITSSLA